MPPTMPMAYPMKIRNFEKAEGGWFIGAGGGGAGFGGGCTAPSKITEYFLNSVSMETLRAISRSTWQLEQMLAVAVMAVLQTGQALKYWGSAVSLT